MSTVVTVPPICDTPLLEHVEQDEHDSSVELMETMRSIGAETSRIPLMPNAACMPKATACCAGNRV